MKNLEKKGFSREKIALDGMDYQVWKRQLVIRSVEAPRLIVVSYLPKKETVELLRICIQTIQKYTDIDYELWVVDNNSPWENVQWLTTEPGINLVLNRTTPKSLSSYANAIGLELGIRVIDPASKFVMTLHQDTAVCRNGWLQFLTGKISDKIRAAGVRRDNTRVKEGILHVLGYVVDFQLFKQLNLDFFPDLPAYDVGDLAMVKLCAAGYDFYSSKNTIWDKTIEITHLRKDKFKDFKVDRSIDDHGHVYFLHLGRGVEKSLGRLESQEKSISIWLSFIRRHLLFYNQLKFNKTKKSVLFDPWYSIRRYFVDVFFLNKISIFEENDLLLDIGGKKENKRGCFNLDDYLFNVKYANIDVASAPDYCCDASSLPVEDGVFNGVIMGELLEHVEDPKVVLAEAFRVLKSGGVLLVTVPFMYHIHADPNDFGRYTEQYWRKVASEIGFSVNSVEFHGGFFAVLANMYKIWLSAYYDRTSILMRIFLRIISPILVKLLLWRDEEIGDNTILQSHTTGFGLVLKKQKL